MPTRTTSQRRKRKPKPEPEYEPWPKPINELTTANFRKIRKLAMADPLPTGWKPSLDEIVFCPRFIPETVATHDKTTKFTKYDSVNATPLQTSTITCRVVATNLVDPDLVKIREVVDKHVPDQRVISHPEEHVVLKTLLRPFRGWNVERERLPKVRKKKPKKGTVQTNGKN